MKTLFFVAALLAAADRAFPQGYVSFFNNSSSRFSTNTPASNPGTGFQTAAAAPVGSYYFALFAAPSTQNTIATYNDPTLNGWTYVAIATNTSLAGRLNGNNADSGNAAQIPGFGAGTVADFAIAGWTANIGTSWALAQAWWNNGNGGPDNPLLSGWFGINSTVANDVQLSNLGGPYNGLFGSASGLINGWGLSFYERPEPGSLSLMFLGLTMMWLHRRRLANFKRQS